MALGLGYVHGLGRLARLRGRAEHHLLQLRAERAAHDRGLAALEERLVHVELVGVHRALDHHLAQAVGRGDEDDLAEAGLGIQREEDAARAQVAAHHLLDRRRQSHVGIGKALVHAIGDGAVVIERGVDVANSGEDVVRPADVEERLLLPGEGGFGEVFGRRGGSDGE
jgi:hypothetical protein